MEKLVARLSLHHVPTVNDTVLAYLASHLWISFSHWEKRLKSHYFFPKAPNFYCPLLL